MNKQQYKMTRLPVWILELLVFAVFCNATVATGVDAQTKPDTTAKTQLVESCGKLPLSFEANRGQMDKKVQYISRNVPANSPAMRDSSSMGDVIRRMGYSLGVHLIC